MYRHLRARYGLWERLQKPWLLVMGESALVTGHFPGLIEQQWLDTPQAVLVWAGEGAEAPTGGWARLRGRIRRAAEGVLLVTDGVALPGTRPAQLAQACGYALPVQLLVSPAIGGARLPQAAPIVALFGAGAAPEAAALREVLQPLPARLAQSGVEALRQDRSAAFDARLSQWLEQYETAFSRGLAQLATHLHRRQRLTALWFAPAPGAGANHRAAESDPLAAHAPGRFTDTAADVAFPDVWLAQWRRVRVRKCRTSVIDGLAYGVLGLTLGLGVGMTISYFANRDQVLQVRAQVDRLDAARTPPQAFAALLALQDTLARLDAQRAGQAPWSQRFGLNHAAPLLDAAWTPYGAAARQWFARPLQAQLARELAALQAVPLDAPPAGEAADTRGTIGQHGYDTLKSWLMLSQIARAQAPYLAPRLVQTARTLWPGEPGDHLERLAGFYAARLPAHPEWALAADAHTLFAARQTLANLIDLKQAADALYGRLLAEARARYPDLRLDSLTGGRDARGLWATPQRLPGVFTRQAYEAYVRDAITALAKQSATAGDWVLGGEEGRRADTPEAMQAQLTRRYFTDFALAWQGFLNRVSWVPEASLSGTAEQLRLYADAQQSPLAALMKTIAWQAQAGAAQKSLADTLVDKARDAFKDKAAAPAAAAVTPANEPGPLAEAFAPLLRLAGETEPNGASAAAAALSLQRYLDRVSATRLKLDQINAAADPDAVARQLAQGLFQGRANDLVDAHDYAALAAASLGSAWAGVGQNLLLRPLDQAWQTLMQPAAASLDGLWAASVATPWAESFAGRYPFNDSDNDAALPELTRFIGPQGLISRFAARELGGLIERQGDQWVPNPLYAQSLRIDPDFLAALNRLAQVADRLYAEGDARCRFELMALGSPKVTDSELVIDGQRLRYFNQKPQWYPLAWPGTPEQAGAQLTWSALATGLRSQASYEGTWALVRLLAQAHAEQVDRANWRLEWPLDDGERLRYALRTQVGSGPLALLQLRGFKLPQRVFLPARERAVPAAPAGRATPHGAA